MPTSNETRVRVEGFWKIIPSVRPGRSSCGSRLCRRSFSSSARSSAVFSSSEFQVPIRVKSRPLRCWETSTMSGGDATRSGSSDGRSLAGQSLLGENVFQCAVTELVEPVRDAHRGALEVDQAPQVDRRSDQDEIRVAAADRLAEIFTLLLAVAHRRKECADVRVLLEGGCDRADG